MQSMIRYQFLWQSPRQQLQLLVQGFCLIRTDDGSAPLHLQWVMYTPTTQYPVVCNGEQYRAMIRREGGQTALQQWLALEAAMQPLQTGAASFPAAAIRSDLGETPQLTPPLPLSNCCTADSLRCPGTL